MARRGRKTGGGVDLVAVMLDLEVERPWPSASSSSLLPRVARHLPRRLPRRPSATPPSPPGLAGRSPEGRPTRSGHARRKWSAELLLVPEHLVVYGDVAMALLYVFKSAFAGGDIEHSAGNEEIYGVLSVVFWMSNLIALHK